MSLANILNSDCKTCSVNEGLLSENSKKEEVEKKKLERKIKFLKNIKKGLKVDVAEEKKEGGEVTKRIVKEKKKWISSFKLSKIEAPQVLTSGRKRFSVKIYFVDDKNKKKTKSIRFGDKNQKDYIDDGDLLKKKSVVSRLHNVNDPFNKSFWRLNLLNNKETLLESYTDVIKQLNLY
jgi:hypothetical protein